MCVCAKSRFLQSLLFLCIDFPRPILFAFCSACVFGVSSLIALHHPCFYFSLLASRLLSQTRTPRVTRLSPTQPALADQASRVSFASAENLESMSDPDIPIGFNRMNRLRQSLPLARSSSQAKLRAPGQSAVFE